MKNLNNTSDIIDALGGIKAIAALAQTTRNAVYNWRNTGQFPADTYRLFKDELAELNIDAPDHLWPMRVAPKKRKAK